MSLNKSQETALNESNDVIEQVTGNSVKQRLHRRLRAIGTLFPIPGILFLTSTPNKSQETALNQSNDFIDGYVL